MLSEIDLVTVDCYVDYVTTSVRGYRDILTYERGDSQIISKCLFIAAECLSCSASITIFTFTSPRQLICHFLLDVALHITSNACR